MAYVLVDILHIDYGVVDERTDGNGKTAEGHCVDADAKGIEHYHRYEEREGYGDERDDRGAHVGEEEHQNDDNKDGTLDERLLHVVDATLDEIGLTEDVGILWQRLLKVVKCKVEVLGEVDGAGVGLLGYGEEYG